MARILVADDDNAVRGVLSMVLERAGYKVLTAASGVEAHEVLKSQPVELVLLDIEMPGMDGFDVCGLMQADQQMRRIPVLMMTGRPVVGVLERVRAVGALDLIPKPFDRVSLLARIALALRSSENRVAT